MYRKSQCNVSQSERKSTIFTSEFRKYVYSFLRKKRAVRVCKKHKRTLDKFLTNLVSEPMISESFETVKHNIRSAGIYPGKKCAIKYFRQLYVISFE